MLNSAKIRVVLEGFDQQVERVLTAVNAAGSDVSEQGKLLQQRFHTDVLPLVATGLELPPAALSALTELNRHMRLLTIEFSFLQAAQQPETAQQKLDQIRERLVQIQGFVGVLRNG